MNTHGCIVRACEKKVGIPKSPSDNTIQSIHTLLKYLYKSAVLYCKLKQCHNTGSYIYYKVLCIKLNLSLLRC